jgi:hypothetical protein
LEDLDTDGSIILKWMGECGLDSYDLIQDMRVMKIEFLFLISRENLRISRRILFHVVR